MHTAFCILTLSILQFGAVKGRVTQLDGLTPIEGIRIDAIDTISHNYMDSDWSDTLGYYNLDLLPTGNYKIHSFNIPTVYVNMYYNGTIFWDSATSINVVSPNVVDSINFRLPLGSKIIGHVFMPDSVTPYKKTCIVGALKNSSNETGGMGVNDTTNGIYNISGLVPGWYKVQAMPWQDTIFALEWYHNANTWATAESLFVDAMDSVMNVNFVLDTGGAITGHIYDTSGSMPLSGVAIAARVLINQYAGWSKVASDTSHIDGSYKLPALRTGDYRVSAAKVGYDTIWYNNQADTSFANLVSVIMPNSTLNINFNMQLTGIVSNNQMNISNPKNIVMRNSPNPFYRKTIINYQVFRGGMVNLSIYNVNGQVVNNLINEYKAPGKYSVLWDGTGNNHVNMSQGVYISRLSCNNTMVVNKMLLVK